MASSEKVYVCGRCEDFGAPTLEELVVHMTSCGYPELRKKGEPIQSDDNEEVYDENSESVDAPEHILPEKKIDQKLEPSLALVGYTNHEAGRSTSPTPFIWSKKTALILLKLLKDHKADMESPYIRRKTVWQKIAAEMLELHGYSVSPSQCENKFKNMSNRYKKARDSNMRSDGRMKQTCFLYNELDEYYRNDPKYNAKQDSRLDLRFEPRFDSRFKPKVVRGSRYIEQEYLGREPIITLSEGENSQYLNSSIQSDTEPVWVQRVVETIEKWHNESMEMQREFIDVLKQLLDKK